MKKNKIIIIVMFIAAVTLLTVGGFLSLNKEKTIKEEDYNPDEYVFKSSDEVVDFLSNIYDSDDVEVVSLDGSECMIKAIDKNGIEYNYVYENDTHLLNVVEESSTPDV